MTFKALCYLLLICSLWPSAALAETVGGAGSLDLTSSWWGYAAIIVFAMAYVLVVLEEKIHLRKSKPVLLAAGIIWMLVALGYRNQIDSGVEDGIRHAFLDYAELFFFLVVAMTYINSMIDRGVFQALRSWLVKRQLSYRKLFWITGVLAFFISPVADNLTTALILCAVILAVGKEQPKFIAISCINIVVAANAGGAFSPFGDITTLMVWQNGVLEFGTFFKLILPSAVNFLVPAVFMQFSVPSGTPEPIAEAESETMQPGGLTIVFLFFLTIATAVSFYNFLHLPPVFGMMLGLAYLKFFSFYLWKTSKHHLTSTLHIQEQSSGHQQQPGGNKFDVFDSIARSEWDTLFFFYGVIMCVGGLSFIGYLGMVSTAMYVDLGPTTANVLVGILSAFVDNIPVMFAVLTMHPDMSQAQWLLVTLTAGVGGSMLSIGSAAGVALMGQARGHYTFLGHLKWTPVIALGYAASIVVHFLVNG